VSYQALADALARRWLASVPAFCPTLRDTGKKHNGHPVFALDYLWPGEGTTVYVYRYTPLNSEHSVLDFVPEGVWL
jgi:hypothetical protein